MLTFGIFVVNGIAFCQFPFVIPLSAITIFSTIFATFAQVSVQNPYEVLSVWCFYSEVHESAFLR